MFKNRLNKSNFMRYLLNIAFFFILSTFFAGQLFASKLINLTKEGQKKRYNLEETTDMLKLSKLISFNLSHDIHVYKCLKISRNAVDLEGAIFILVASKTKLGYALDDQEVDLIIRLSKLNTEVYQDVMNAAKKIGKVRTTVKEHNNISSVVEKGNGRALLEGIDTATGCNYKIENDYFSISRLDLLVKVGKLNDKDRFFDIYDAMRKVGMESKIHSRALNVIYKLYNIKGDVPYQIMEYLRVNKWRSRKQPGDREYLVIKDMMTDKGVENEIEPGENENKALNVSPLLKKTGSTQVKKSKKRKKKRKSSAKSSTKKKSNFSDPCSDYIPIKKNK